MTGFEETKRSIEAEGAALEYLDHLQISQPGIVGAFIKILKFHGVINVDITASEFSYSLASFRGASGGKFIPFFGYAKFKLNQDRGLYIDNNGNEVMKF